jgi:hypothetical protein
MKNDKVKNASGRSNVTMIKIQVFDPMWQKQWTKWWIQCDKDNGPGGRSNVTKTMNQVVNPMWQW